MKQLAKFAIHAVVATVGSTVFGMIFSDLLASSAKNLWFDVPYSPFLWGSALAFGFVLTWLLKDTSARWVWVVGITWFVFVAVSELRFYRADSCEGCTLSQYFWYSFFSYRNMIGEALGELVATTPMLNSLSYSIGALLAIALERSGPRPQEYSAPHPRQP